jgi:coenzyme F420-reducing hydrogenase beta subunit
MNLIQTVDALGRLKADIANLKAQEETLKADLISAAVCVGTATVDGALFRSTVSFTDKRVVDYKAILATLVDLGLVKKLAMESMIAKNTKVAEGVPCVRLTARKAA